MDTLKMIGKFIERERTKQNLTLSQLSKKAFGNIHNGKSISLIERGLVNSVQFNTINIILIALNYDIKDYIKSIK